MLDVCEDVLSRRDARMRCLGVERQVATTVATAARRRGQAGGAPRQKKARFVHESGPLDGWRRVDSNHRPRAYEFLVPEDKGLWGFWPVSWSGSPGYPEQSLVPSFLVTLPWSQSLSHSLLVTVLWSGLLLLPSVRIQGVPDPPDSLGERGTPPSGIKDFRRPTCELDSRPVIQRQSSTAYTSGRS